MRISETHAMRMRDAFREMFRDAHQYAYDAYRNAHTKMHFNSHLNGFIKTVSKCASDLFRDAHLMRALRLIYKLAWDEGLFHSKQQ